MISPAPHTRLLHAPAAFVFRFRDYLAPVLAIGILLGSRPQDFVDQEVDAWARIAGVLLLAAGLGIRMLVAGQVDIRRSGVRKRVAASRLVVSGLYAHTRNPLYLANMTLVLALTLVYDSRRAYAIVLPLVVLSFLAIVWLEEEFLAAKFGREYTGYRARTPRFLPKLRGLAATIRLTPIDWRRALRREYGPAFATVSAALVFVAARDVFVAGFHASAPRLNGLFGAWVASLLVYVAVRWMKKSGRLETNEARLLPLHV